MKRLVLIALLVACGDKKSDVPAATVSDVSIQDGELRWAGSACCDVTASAQQVHGAIGFALETGLHVYYRRARAAQAWAVAACDALR